MITSLSKYRLTETSTKVADLWGFSVVASNNNHLATQIYVVPVGYEGSPRTEPLAHIYKLESGEVNFKTFQPELYSLEGLTEDELWEEVIYRIEAHNT
jgi:hypothetical protein